MILIMFITITSSIILYFYLRVTIKDLMYNYLHDSLTDDEKYNYELTLSGGEYWRKFRKELPLGDFTLDYWIEHDEYTIRIMDNNNELFRLQKKFLDQRFSIGKLTKKEVKSLFKMEILNK